MKKKSQVVRLLKIRESGGVVEELVEMSDYASVRALLRISRRYKLSEHAERCEEALKKRDRMDEEAREVKFLHTWGEVLDAYILLRGPDKRDYWFATFARKLLKTPRASVGDVRVDPRAEVFLSDVEAFVTSGR